MAENPQPLTRKTITAIQNNAKTITNIAAEISKATRVPITPLGIASPVAREMNKDEIDYPQIFVPFRDAIVSGTNDRLMQNYNYVLKNDPTNRISTVRGIYNRLTNPALNDIGPGKFKIATAESLLQGYLRDNRFAKDPLDLFKYDGHLDQLVRDLNSNTSATAPNLSYKLSGLINLQAVDWYTSTMGQARWSQYNPEQQAQLIATYYTLGQKEMTDRATAQIAKSGIYTPDLNSDGGVYVGSGSNMGVMKGALGQGAIVTRPDGTTQYLDGNGKIIREDSPAVILDPAEAAGSGFQSKSTIKEFDQNNNVIRNTQKFSSADGSQSDATQFASSANPIQAPARGQMAASGQGTDAATANAGGPLQFSRFNQNGFRQAAQYPDGPAPASAAPATPAFQQNAVYSPTGDFYGNFPGASAIAAAPSPPALNDSGSGSSARTDVYAVAQGIRRLMSDAGQYMWNGLPSSAQAVLLSRPPLPGQAALDLAGEETQQDPGNVPERRLARMIVNSSAGGPADARSSPAPQPQDSQGPLSLEEAYRLYLAKLNANKPQASTPDPAAPFDASYGNPPGFRAADWIASLAGVDRQNPAQPASSPQARGLAGSRYGDNPMQSWGDAPAYAGGLLNRIDLASLDPQYPDQPEPSPTDDEQDQAKLRELDEKLSSTGDIRDAVALYNARKAIRAKGTFGQA